MRDVTNHAAVALRRWVPEEPTSGIDPRSRYVEHFWVPTVGPVAVCLARTLMRIVSREGKAVVVRVEDLQEMLGLHGPRADADLGAAIAALLDHGVLVEDHDPDDEDTLEGVETDVAVDLTDEGPDTPLLLLVRSQFPYLDDGQVADLPGDLAIAHRAPHSMRAAAALEAPIGRPADLGPHLRVLSLASTIDEILVNPSLDAAQLAFRWQHVIRLAEEARDDAVLDWVPADLESSVAECHLAAQAVNEALWQAQCAVAIRRSLGEDQRTELAEAAAGVVDWLVSEHPPTASDLDI